MTYSYIEGNDPKLIVRDIQYFGIFRGFIEFDKISLYRRVDPLSSSAESEYSNQ